jgi:hypothetical protein
MSWGTHIMAKYKAVHFKCPSCNTLYHVVKTEAGPVAIDSWVTCRTCHAPIPAREGKFRLKYFILRQAARRDPRARAGSQRIKPAPSTKTKGARKSAPAINLGRAAGEETQEPEAAT